MKVKMLPTHTPHTKLTNGIAQVVAAYTRYLPQYGVELTSGDSYDLLVTHAGLQGLPCDVAHLHGLYWTADYDAPAWEYATNANIVKALRTARRVSVPSAWVAQTLQRDMHLSPAIIPHGIDWQAWQTDTIFSNTPYVLYNKNRRGDVCDSTPLEYLADRRPDLQFVSTFASHPRPNLLITGVLPHERMKSLVQGAAVYLATTKETFGIGILEAMASGVPVLGYAHGGVCDLVQHGINGYLAQPGNTEELLAGLDYCVQHRHTLGANGRTLARAFTWEAATRQVADLYYAALQRPAPTVAIIIPTYNYGRIVGRAIESALKQDYPLVQDIIVVDDGSSDDTREQVAPYLVHKQVRYVYQENQGVAHARNHGIELTAANYICCLDADDTLEPAFISTCVSALEQEPALGIAYTNLNYVTTRGSEPGSWPGEFDYDQQLQGHNQIPTCCLFRRVAWERGGGYRQRYAPGGCGTEDAELWLRMGALGFQAARVSTKCLFNYRAGGRTSKRGYVETSWLDWHPWVFDHQHPFASIATPTRQSHPVRQYDNPYISVIIPVGPGHETHVIEALDSLEAQTLRQWQGIVVWDTGTPIPSTLLNAYPFIVWLTTAGQTGAGAARNTGARQATAPLLLFLDADDWLLPQALELLLQAYNETGAIVYSASLGVQAMAESDLPHKRGDVVKYEQGIATLYQGIAPYNYELAIQQPFTNKPYFWCYVSSLVPQDWHTAIGGFDETLAAWEDWDYWIRLAKAGRDFVSLPLPLIVYRYDTGTRRELGKSIRDDLMATLRAKHEGVEIMGCKGCGSKQVRIAPVSPRPAANATMLSSGRATTMDDNFVLIEYQPLRGGSHGVLGTTTFGQRLVDNMRRTNRGWIFDYGYRSRGDRFLVHRADQSAQPNIFVLVKSPLAPPPTAAPAPPPPAPVALTEQTEPGVKATPAPLRKFNLLAMPGVTEQIAQALEQAGWTTPEALLEADLTTIKGIGKAKADSIKTYLRGQLAARDVLEELRKAMS